ncbi:MAG: SusC/RagA family TonB-linked outer membrane protein [Candidatus Pseudobacter hemicellulosilyticus]|uniref:SusC/RagA family TonB-linked outer membrane protein n=1 Tax=Candidatus Pseudobacter hemicellulosilyticus TaxID=3121375 RepID=A0AAJ5WQE8_9BACT|nr:MAG: SusC/RagA family TonB-linked outer membrane protein [Pseudobacter sp.]
MRLLCHYRGSIPFLLFFFLLPGLVPKLSAQVITSNAATRDYSGTVTDSTGVPLPHVSVTIKGSSRGTISNEKGQFTLRASAGEILVLSAVNFLQQEILLGGETSLQVQLYTLSTGLNEVVVIGYGTQRRGDVTSSVASVKAGNFVKAPVLDAGQLLQGKVAGLTVSTTSGDPTSGTQILLRGSTTLLGANANPLVLIDGVPGDLKTVAPEDIEAMDVLKDGSAAAIYGTRGTNGVILVTTRRAGSNNVSSVDYSGSLSTQTIARRPELLTADDYRQQIADGLRDATWDKGGSTDWLDEITRTPISQVHNISFRGGNSKTNYLANANYRQFEGIFLKSDNRTFTGRLDINHSMLDDKLKLNLGIISSQNDYTATGDGSSFNGYTYRQAMIFNPTSPLRDPEGNWFEEPGQFNYDNPLSRLMESDGRHSAQNTRYNANITLLPIKGLRLNGLFSYTKYNQTRGYFETKNNISTVRGNRNGYASVGGIESVYRLMELTAQYSKTISDHNFSILGGYGYQEDEFQEHWMQNWDFPTDIFGYSNIGLGKALAEGLAPQYSYKRVGNLISFFGRATYSYKDRYLLLASLRHEAANQLFGTRNPWGTFPAISLGWRISRESFMANSIFDDLKLRGGYGVTGSQPNSIFLGLGTLAYTGWFYTNGQWINTLVPARNPNPYLKWEEKKETNIGIDFSLFKGRISGSVDYYIRTIDGLLYDFAVPMPPNTYGYTRANVGKMENKGLEVQLNGIPVETTDFSWNTSLNFSTNKNSLVTLSNDLYQFTADFFTTGGTGEPIQTYTHRVSIGGPIGDFYGFRVIDVDEQGRWIYEGEDGKHVAYADFAHEPESKKILGNGLPKYYGAWNNSFRYKNFDLNITMRGAFDYQILNFQRMYYENTNIQQYNRLKSAYDPVFGKAVLSKDMPLEFNSYYVEDGDYWKIDNIVLGYSIPRLGIRYVKSARVYVSTLNTATITGYKGIDPEVNRLGLDPGIEGRDIFPTTRTYTLGILLNF